MSIDPSLRIQSGLSSHRNVLTRGERIKRLQETTPYDSQKKGVLGLPKTANRKAKVGA